MASSLHRNAGLYIAGKAANLLLAPLALILLPGLMGDKGYGQYGYWFSIISLYLVLLDFGSQAMLRRYLPQLMLQNRGQAKTLFIRSQQLKFLPLALLLAACFFSHNYWVQFTLLATALAAALVTSIADAMYAAQKMGWHSLTQLSRRILRLILAPIGFLVWHIHGLLIALLVAELLPLLFWPVARKLFSEKSLPLQKPFLNYYKVGVIGFAGFFIATLMGRFPVLSAQWSGYTLEQIGHIALCVDLTYFALKELLNAISESILPRMIELKSENDEPRVHELVSTNYRFINLAGLYVIALGIPLAPAFLLMLGDSFYNITSALQWMLVAVLFGSLNSVQNQILFINDAAIKIFYSQLIGMVVLLVLFAISYNTKTNIFVICILLAFAMLATAASSYLFSRKYIGSTNNIRHFLGLLPAAACSFIFLWSWQPRGIVPSLSAGLIASIIYIVLVVLFKGISDNDINAIKKTLGRTS